MNKLSGIFPPIPTPFVQGEVALEKVRRNLSRWNETAVQGYVVFGSNGESVFLTRDEKVSLLTTVREHAPGDKTIIAGTGSESIKETISLTNEASALGADYALVVTPSYYKAEMKHDSFILYYTAIADAVRIPVILYNVPKFTGVDLQTETVAVLAEHPNIVGIKNSTENIRQLMEFRYNTPDDFSVIVGTASLLYSGFASGAGGAIVALANIAPNECAEIQHKVAAGKLAEALSLQNRLIPLNSAITTKYGVAGLKAAMDILGYYGGEPRRPLLPLGQREMEEVRRTVMDAGIR